MRRLALVVALLALLVVPGTAAAATHNCSLEVSPVAGSATDTYRIRVSNLPVNPEGWGIEVRLDVRKLGTREGSTYFVFLIPGVTEFYVDHNASAPGEPAPDPLAAGRYRVFAETAHIGGTGCHAVGQFIVA